jgi:hypothetical protein
VEAAEAEDGGGLAGSWWRFWAGVSSALLAMRLRSPLVFRSLSDGPLDSVE